MIKHRITAGLVGAGLFAGVLATSASAATLPSTAPLPTPAKGATLQQVASGVTTPTAFAFGDDNVFVSDGTFSKSGPPTGGVYVLKNGVAVRLAGSPTASFGVVWHHHRLYVSAINMGSAGPVSTIQAWSGWNGITFTSQKVLYTAPAGIILNGLAFGANRRLYTGVDVGLSNDHGPKKGLLYDLLSFKKNGTDMRVVATGMRQPWQIAFNGGSLKPFVSDLGQDSPPKTQRTVPDFILHVRDGQNYGFPKCNWIVVVRCLKYSRPFKFFQPHTDPGGLGIIGNRLYFSEFGFVHTAKVQSVKVGGGGMNTLLTGFKGEALIGLETNGGWVYVGEAATSPGTGRVFRVKP